jgi:RND family efflux transporter MFP subunit
MRKALDTLLVCAALLAVGIPASAQNGQPAASTGVQQVTFSRFADVAVYPQREAAATAQSLNETRLSAEVSASVIAVPAQVGETVARGAVLIRLDARDFELAVARAQAGLESAQARLKQAESQLRRARDLQARNFISPEGLLQRETEVDVLRAEVKLQRNQLDTARRNLAKTTIRAPFRAIVKAREADVGELAAPGTPLLTLIDVERIEVAAQVQVKDTASLQAAREVALQAHGTAYPLKLLRVSPAINRESRNVEARLAFAGKPAPAGADGRIVWRDHRPHVPAELIVRREGKLGMFVLNSEQPRFIALPEAQEGRPAPADLPPDIRIVIDGRFGLREGNAAAPAPAAPARP